MEQTTLVVQRCLDALGEAPAPEEAIRDLLAPAVKRLHSCCAALLHHGYARLTRPPLGLTTEELLSGVVERLLKALRQVRPADARQFFALANQHIRWELNDLARRLDNHPRLHGLPDELAAAQESSSSSLSLPSRRILQAIAALPDEEREVFDLVHVQGLTHGETAELVGVAPKTVQRRLHRALVLLAEQLHDLVG